MDRGAWWAAVHGVTKSQTWLRSLTVYVCVCTCVCVYAGSIIFRAYKTYGNHIPSTCTKREIENDV